MLITFRCHSHSNISMFGDIAIKMLEMMGHSLSVPGAMSDKDIPNALSSLTSALSEQKAIDQNNKQIIEENEEQEKQMVSLEHRAFPLIELLESAIKEKCGVTWDYQ